MRDPLPTFEETMTTTFTVTDDHLKLLRAMYIRYEDECEFGAPAVDPKRPYGNSSVYGDIAEILSIGEGQADGFTHEQLERMERLHRETTNVLQILVQHGTLPATTFEHGARIARWRPVGMTSP